MSFLVMCWHDCGKGLPAIPENKVLSRIWQLNDLSRNEVIRDALWPVFWDSQGSHPPPSTTSLSPTNTLRDFSASFSLCCQENTVSCCFCLTSRGSTVCNDYQQNKFWFVWYLLSFFNNTLRKSKMFPHSWFETDRSHQNFNTTSITDLKGFFDGSLNV